MNKFIFLFLMIFISACHRKKILESYGNGQPKLECEMSNGIKNGTCIQYFEDGVVKSQVSYLNGKKEGEGIFYHPNGEIHYKGVIHNDNLNGNIIFFDSSGIKYQSSEIMQGDLNGKSIAYFKNGNVQKEVNYRRGKFNGHYKTYYSNGRLKKDSKYIDGCFIEFVEYNVKGNIINQTLKYKIHQLGSGLIKIKLTNPIYDIFGVQILEAPKMKNDTLKVVAQYVSRNDSLTFHFDQSNVKNDTLRGIIFEAKSVGNNKEVAKRTERFTFKLKK